MLQLPSFFTFEPQFTIEPIFENSLSNQSSQPYIQEGELSFPLRNYGEIYFLFLWLL